MSMSQLEKFHARQSKMKKDEQVLREAEMKGNTVENKGKEIARRVGVSTEDIFAVITRESLGPFVQMWNNSMESTLKETLRTEMKDIIREIVQEEMQAAFRGIIKGLMPEVNEQPTIEENIEFAFTEEPEIEIRSVASTAKKEKIIIDPVIQAQKDGEFEFLKTDTIQDIVIMMMKKSIDPRVGVNWVKAKGRANSLYNGFMVENKGIKGAWKKHIEEIMFNFNLSEHDIVQY